jgi:methanogenic corrinoid protein MtbC1
MQTSQAINALRHQEQTGHLILTEQSLSVLQAGEILRSTTGGRKIIEDTGDPLPAFKDRLLDALVDRDISRADEILGEALAASGPENLILKVIGPALGKIGDLWEAGTISVATEHLGTNYLRHRLLLWMLSGPPPQSRHTLVLACAPNEWHEGSLLILGSLLRRRRWLVSYLGQAVPLPDLASFVQDLKPFMVILVAMTEQSAASLVEWPDWMPEVARSNHPIIGYGGRIFIERPEWRLKMRGMYLGNTFEEGLGTIERLLGDWAQI